MIGDPCNIITSCFSIFIALASGLGLKLIDFGLLYQEDGEKESAFEEAFLVNTHQVSRLSLAAISIG